MGTIAARDCLRGAGAGRAGGRHPAARLHAGRGSAPAAALPPPHPHPAPGGAGPGVVQRRRSPAGPGHRRAAGALPGRGAAHRRAGGAAPAGTPAAIHSGLGWSAPVRIAGAAGGGGRVSDRRGAGRGRHGGGLPGRAPGHRAAGGPEDGVDRRARAAGGHPGGDPDAGPAGPPRHRAAAGPGAGGWAALVRHGAAGGTDAVAVPRRRLGATRRRRSHGLHHRRERARAHPVR